MMMVLQLRTAKLVVLNHIDLLQIEARNALHWTATVMKMRAMKILSPCSKRARRANAFLDDDSDSCNTVTPTTSNTTTISSTTPPATPSQQSQMPPLHEAHQALVALADAAAASLQKVM